MIELRHLRYAIAVAEERHITRAAERLGIQQPPLSQQIRALERTVGVALFRRLPRGVAPTPAGEAFVARARIALREADAATDAARRVGRGEAGSLAVGVTNSAAFHPLVSRTIRRLHEAAPALRLSLVETNSAALFNSVRDGRIDAAMVRASTAHNPGPTAPGLTTPGLTMLALPDEEMVAALPAEHPLLADWPADGQRPLAALAGADFILYHRSSGPGLYDAIIAACDRAGFSPRIAQEASQLIATLSLVSANLGVSLVPRAMARLGTAGVAYRALTPGTAPLAPLALIWRQGEETGPLARLIAEVRQTLRQPR